MKRIIIMIFCIILIGCNQTDNQDSENLKNTSITSASTEDGNIIISKIEDEIWLHTSYMMIGEHNVPANGLLFESEDGFLLVDTPWNNEQTKELMTLLENTFNKTVTTAIVTHVHDDTIGGIDTLLMSKIPVHSIALTRSIANETGYGLPTDILNDEDSLTFGSHKLEIYYPGPGHAPDNIVIWSEEDKLLFGGCLLKSLKAKNIGSVIDANQDEWPKSVQNVMDRYPNAEIVIPGHGDYGDSSLLSHTLDIVKDN